MGSIGKAPVGATVNSQDNSRDLELCRFIIRSLPVGVLTVNSDLDITSFNPWAETMTGYAAREAMGRYCGEILQGRMCKLNCPLKVSIKPQNPIVRLETTIQNRHGETIPVRMNTAALLDDDGNLIGGIEVFQDISHIKALERERDNLISMFAHDMKSSLAAIGGFALRLSKKTTSLNQEKQKKYLDIIKKEATKLEFLVNDFIEFARLQTGRLKLNFGPTCLDKELIELVDAYQIRTSQSGIKLELQNEEALPIIEADAHQLRRVFTNLLDNAFKFSKEKQKITITTQETSQEIIVKFIDQGSGIDPGELPHIFDPFHRGQVGGKIEGFGLGLAAVKAIVEAHGGQVLVESELSNGSIFTVVLPKAGKPKDRKRKNGVDV